MARRKRKLSKAERDMIPLVLTLAAYTLEQTGTQLRPDTLDSPLMVLKVSQLIVANEEDFADVLAA